MPTLEVVIAANKAKAGADQFSQATDQMSASAGKSTKETEALQKAMDRIEKEGHAVAEVMKEVRGATGQLNQVTDTMNRTLQKSAEEITQLQQKTNQLEMQNQELADALKEVTDRNKQLATAHDKLSSESDEARRKTAELDAAMNKLNARGQAVAGTVKTLVAGFLGFQAIRRAGTIMAGFEQTMKFVSGVTGATASQFEDLEAAAREMGSATRFSAQQAGDGLLFLARAGFTVDEAIEALPATLNLALGGAIELGDAADYASNILSQFNLEASETVRVVDVLISTSNRANTDVTQLAQALKFAGPVAGSLGIEIEETAAAIGVLSDAGIQGALAGTTLRQTMISLLSETPKTSKALAALGLTFDEIRADQNSLTDIMLKFAEANITAEQAVRLFSSRQAAGVLQLVDNVDKLQQLDQANKAAEGSAQDFADTIDDSLKGAYFALIAATEEAILKTGEEGMLGVTKDVINTLTDAIRILTGTSDATEQATFQARLLADAFYALAAAAAVSGIARSIALYIEMAAAIRAARVAQEGLNLAIARSPWGLIALGIGLVSAAVYELAIASDDAVGDVKVLNQELAALDNVADSINSTRNRLRQVDLLDTERLEDETARAVRMLENYREQVVAARAAGETRLPARSVPFALELLGGDDLPTVGDSTVGLELVQRSIEKALVKQRQLSAELESDGPAAAIKREMDSLAREIASGNQALLANEIGDAFGIEALQSAALGSTFQIEAFRARIADLTAEYKRLEQGLKDLKTTQGDQQSIAAAQAFLDTEESLQDLIATQRLEIDVIGLSEGARDRRLRQLEVEALAQEGLAEATDKQKQVIMQLLETYRANDEILNRADDERAHADAIRESTEATRDQIQNLELELKLIGANNAERQIARATAEAFNNSENLSLQERIQHLQRVLFLQGQINQGQRTDQITALTGSLEDQIAVQRLLNDEQFIQADVLQLTNRLRDQGITLLPQEIAHLEDLIKTLRDLQNVGSDGSSRSPTEEALATLREELTLTGRIGDARERAEAKIRAEALAYDEFNDGKRTEAEVQAKVNQFTAEYLVLLDKINQAQSLVSLAIDIGEEFGSAFEDVVFGAQSAEEAVESFIKNTSRLVFNQLVTQQLSSFVSNIAFAGFGGQGLTGGGGIPIRSAKGNAFMGGDLVPFAKGGLPDQGMITNTAIFPLNNGKVGVAGEAGVEAALKVTRLPNGDLGVASPATKGGDSYNVNVYVNGVQNPGEFMNSEDQLTRGIRRALSRAKGR